ncbi:hypothetical protein [Nocardia yunnanensis]|nr:hypothetical protein [Nocardia yunnanensis]
MTAAIEYSFTGPAVLAPLTAPTWVQREGNEHGYLSWLSPLVSTPLGIQFDYSAAVFNPGQVSLVRHEVSATVGIDGAEPFLIPDRSTRSSEKMSRTSFLAISPTGRAAEVVITVTDHLSGVTYSTGHLSIQGLTE